MATVAVMTEPPRSPTTNGRRSLRTTCLTVKNRLETRRLTDKLEMLEKSRTSALRQFGTRREKLAAVLEEKSRSKRISLPIIGEKQTSSTNDSKFLFTSGGGCQGSDITSEDGLTTTYAESIICLDVDDATMSTSSPKSKTEVRKWSSPVFRSDRPRRSGAFCLSPFAVDPTHPRPDIPSNRAHASSSLRRHKSMYEAPDLKRLERVSWHQHQRNQQQTASPPPVPLRCLVKSQSMPNFATLTAGAIGSPTQSPRVHAKGGGAALKKKSTSPILSSTYCAACRSVCGCKLYEESKEFGNLPLADQMKIVGSSRYLRTSSSSSCSSPPSTL